MENNFRDNRSYLDMELLRFTTAGSVDDGKSTLIGRLLYDSKSIFEDQLEAIKNTSKNRGSQEVDLALFTDGLRDERAQGITIDVAYRYFATPKRKFIIADTPGHIQYTRNMVTGASTANLALILIDARNGIVEQTLRHSYIASLLQIPHILVCVNKMDLIDYNQETYENIVNDYRKFSAKLNVKDIQFVPVSALKGDNIVKRSECMDWYQGGTLLNTLETIHIGSDYNHIDARFPIQNVLRPQTDEYHDYRAYAGRISSGVIRKGDKVKVLPSGFTSTIKEITTFKGELEEAFPPMSVAVQLEDDIDISRGDMLVREGNQPEVTQDITAMVVWMGENPLQLGRKYILMHTSNEVKTIIKSIQYKVDISTLKRNEEDKVIAKNDIAKLSLRTTKPLFVDSYRTNRITGSFILIDEGTKETIGVCMVS
ncbi:MAG: sulfate adenylyltransferase subunit 1 [Flavobacteriales bacterium]